MTTVKLFVANVLSKIDRYFEKDLGKFPRMRTFVVPERFARHIDGNDYNSETDKNIWHFFFEQMTSFFIERPYLLSLKNFNIYAYVQAGVTPKTNLIISDGKRFYRFLFKVTWGYQSLKRKLALLLQDGRSDHRTFAVLGAMNSSNYYHFIHDVIGDLWFIKHHIDTTVDCYLILTTRNRWRERLLELAGLRPEQLIFADEFAVKGCNLIIPMRTKGVATVTPFWIHEALVSTFSLPLNRTRGSRRIFISRNDATARRMLNSDSLFHDLENFGFERYILSELSIDEQQLIFKEAGMVVAEHGAGLTNLLWSGRGTYVIDIH
jgi:hypothetical protein